MLCNEINTLPSENTKKAQNKKKHIILWSLLGTLSAGCIVVGLGVGLSQRIPSSTNINTMITIIDLGYIVNDDDDTLINTINLKNGTTFTTDDLIFTYKSPTSATVAGQNQYKGNVNITFAVSTDINTLITITNLGCISNDDDSSLTNVINIDNGTTFVTNDLDFTSHTDTMATVTGQGKYQGSIDISFETTNDIDKLIAVKDLGYLMNNNDSTLVATININNRRNGTTFTIDDLIFTEVNTTSATVTGRNQYRGTLNLTFEISVDINTLITTTNIDYIANDEDSTLISSINVKNGTTFVAGDLTFTNKTTTSVTITGQDKYQGSVVINFAISNDINLIIANKNIGVVTDDGDDTLIADINNKNGTTFTTADLNFTNKNTGSVMATGQGQYQGSAQINFGTISGINWDGQQPSNLEGLSGSATYIAEVYGQGTLDSSACDVDWNWETLNGDQTLPSGLTITATNSGTNNDEYDLAWDYTGSVDCSVQLKIIATSHADDRYTINTSTLLTAQKTSTAAIHGSSTVTADYDRDGTANFTVTYAGVDPSTGTDWTVDSVTPVAQDAFSFTSASQNLTGTLQWDHTKIECLDYTVTIKATSKANSSTYATKNVVIHNRGAVESIVISGGWTTGGISAQVVGVNVDQGVTWSLNNVAYSNAQDCSTRVWIDNANLNSTEIKSEYNGLGWGRAEWDLIAVSSQDARVSNTVPGSWNWNNDEP